MSLRRRLIAFTWIISAALLGKVAFTELCMPADALLNRAKLLSQLQPGSDPTKPIFFTAHDGMILIEWYQLENFPATFIMAGQLALA